MDPINFSNEKIEEYFQMAEAFVQEIYDEKHLHSFANDEDREKKGRRNNQ